MLHLALAPAAVHSFRYSANSCDAFGMKAMQSLPRVCMAPGGNLVYKLAVL